LSNRLLFRVNKLMMNGRSHIQTINRLIKNIPNYWFGFTAELATKLARQGVSNTTDSPLLLETDNIHPDCQRERQAW